MTPDVNVLVAALRPDHPQHFQAHRWLADAIQACASGAGIEILPMVGVGFVRVVTDPRVFPTVTPMGDAIAFLRSILQEPGVSMPELGSEWSVFESLCLGRRLRGKIISDAWIAAAVKANGLHLITFDSDFRELLRSDQYTLLPPGPNLREPQRRYFVHPHSAGFDNRALAA